MGVGVGESGRWGSQQRGGGGRKGGKGTAKHATAVVPREKKGRQDQKRNAHVRLRPGQTGREGAQGQEATAISVCEMSSF
jgi:hypothetical protein